MCDGSVTVILLKGSKQMIQFFLLFLVVGLVFIKSFLYFLLNEIGQKHWRYLGKKLIGRDSGVEIRKILKECCLIRAVTNPIK